MSLIPPASETAAIYAKTISDYEQCVLKNLITRCRDAIIARRSVHDELPIKVGVGDSPREVVETVIQELKKMGYNAIYTGFKDEPIGQYGLLNHKQDTRRIEISWDK